MNEFFTWAFLSTFAGAVLVTGIVTEILKKVAGRIPTQVVSYIVALLLLLCVTVALQQAHSLADWLLIPFNALAVSLGANGGYEAVKRIGG